jgi:ribosomal 50S subunit-recycling heat shock protein
MRLYKLLVEEKLVRSRTEAERLIKQGAVSVGGCKADCSFFSTGRCTCNGWRKVTKATEEIEVGLAVKIGNGFWRVMTRLDGQQGFDLVNGIGRSRAEAERPSDPNQLAKLVVDIATGEVEDDLSPKPKE